MLKSKLADSPIDLTAFASNDIRAFSGDFRFPDRTPNYGRRPEFLSIIIVGILPMSDYRFNRAYMPDRFGAVTSQIPACPKKRKRRCDALGLPREFFDMGPAANIPA